MKNCIRLLDDYKTYGKLFQVDPCSNYDVTLKTTKYYNLLSKTYLLDSYESLYTSFRRPEDLC